MDCEGKCENINSYPVNNKVVSHSRHAEKASDFSGLSTLSYEMHPEKRKASCSRSPVVVLEDLQLPNSKYCRIKTSQLRELKHNLKHIRVGPKSKISQKSKQLELEKHSSTKIKSSIVEDISDYHGCQNATSQQHQNYKSKGHCKFDITKSSLKVKKLSKKDSPHMSEKLLDKHPTGYKTDSGVQNERNPLPLVDPKVIGLSSILQQDGSSQFKKFTLKKKDKSFHQNHFHKVFTAVEPSKKKEITTKTSSTYQDFKKKYKDVIRTSHVLTAVRKKVNNSQGIVSSQKITAQVTSQSQHFHKKSEMLLKSVFKDKVTSERNVSMLKQTNASLPTISRMEHVKPQSTNWAADSHNRKVSKDNQIGLNSVFMKSFKSGDYCDRMEGNITPVNNVTDVEKTTPAHIETIDLDTCSKLIDVNIVDPNASDFMDRCLSTLEKTNNTVAEQKHTLPISSVMSESNVDTFYKDLGAFTDNVNIKSSSETNRENSDTKHIQHGQANSSEVTQLQIKSSSSYIKDVDSALCIENAICSISSVTDAAHKTNFEDSVYKTENRLDIASKLLDSENNVDSTSSFSSVINTNMIEYDSVSPHVTPSLTCNTVNCVDLSTNSSNSRNMDIVACATMTESTDVDAHVDQVNVAYVTKAADGNSIIASNNHQSNDYNDITNEIQPSRCMEKSCLFDGESKKSRDDEKQKGTELQVSDNSSALNCVSPQVRDSFQGSLTGSDILSESTKPEIKNVPSKVPFKMCSSTDDDIIMQQEYIDGNENVEGNKFNKDTEDHIIKHMENHKDQNICSIVEEQSSLEMASPKITSDITRDSYCNIQEDKVSNTEISTDKGLTDEPLNGRNELKCFPGIQEKPFRDGADNDNKIGHSISFEADSSISVKKSKPVGIVTVDEHFQNDTSNETLNENIQQHIVPLIFQNLTSISKTVLRDSHTDKKSKQQENIIVVPETTPSKTDESMPWSLDKATLEPCGFPAENDCSLDESSDLKESLDNTKIQKAENATNILCSKGAPQIDNKKSPLTAFEDNLPVTISQSSLDVGSDGEYDLDPCPPLLHQETSPEHMEDSLIKSNSLVGSPSQIESRSSGLFDYPPVLRKEVSPTSLNLHYEHMNDQKGNTIVSDGFHPDSTNDGCDKRFSCENLASEEIDQNVVPLLSQSQRECFDEQNKINNIRQSVKCDINKSLDFYIDSTMSNQDDIILNSVDQENPITEEESVLSNVSCESGNTPRENIAQSPDVDTSNCMEPVSFHSDIPCLKTSGTFSKSSQGLIPLENTFSMSLADCSVENSEEYDLQTCVPDNKMEQEAIIHQKNDPENPPSPISQQSMENNNQHIQQQTALEDFSPKEPQVINVTGHERDSQILLNQSETLPFLQPLNKDSPLDNDSVISKYSNHGNTDHISDILTGSFDGQNEGLLSSSEYANDQIAMLNAYANITSSSSSLQSTSALNGTAGDYINVEENNVDRIQIEKMKQYVPETCHKSPQSISISSIAVENDRTDNVYDPTVMLSASLCYPTSTSQISETSKADTEDNSLTVSVHNQQKEIPVLCQPLEYALLSDDCPLEAIFLSENIVENNGEHGEGCNEDWTSENPVGISVSKIRMDKTNTTTCSHGETFMTERSVVVHGSVDLSDEAEISECIERQGNLNKQHDNLVSGVILSLTASNVNCPEIGGIKQSMDSNLSKHMGNMENGLNHVDVSESSSNKTSELAVQGLPQANSDLVMMKAKNDENDRILAQFEEFERTEPSEDLQNMLQLDDSLTCEEEDQLMIDEEETFCQKTISKEAAENAVSMVITDVDEITRVNNYGFSLTSLEKGNLSDSESYKKMDVYKSRQIHDKDPIYTSNDRSSDTIARIGENRKSKAPIKFRLLLPKNDTKVNKGNREKIEGMEICTSNNRTETGSYVPLTKESGTLISGVPIKVKKKGRPLKRRRNSKTPLKKSVVTVTEASALIVKRKRATKAVIQERLKQDTAVFKVFQTRAKTRALKQNEPERSTMVLQGNKKGKRGKKRFGFRKEQLKSDKSCYADKTTNVSSDSYSQDDYMKSLDLKPARMSDSQAMTSTRKTSIKRGRPCRRKINRKVRSKLVSSKAYSNMEESTDEEVCEDSKEKDVVTRFLAEVESNTDELPTILPPKRRRRLPIVEKMESSERIAQEFPKHNWLENKISLLDENKKNKKVLEELDIQGTRIVKEKLNKKAKTVTSSICVDSVNEAPDGLQEAMPHDDDTGQMDGQPDGHTSQVPEERPTEETPCTTTVEQDSALNNQSEREQAAGADSLFPCDSSETINNCQIPDSSCLHVTQEKAELDAELTSFEEEPHNLLKPKEFDCEIDENSSSQEKENQSNKDDQQLFCDSLGSTSKSLEISCQTSIEEDNKSTLVMSSDTSSKSATGKIVSTRPTGVVHPSSKTCAPVQMVQPQVYASTETSTPPEPPLVTQTKQSISDIVTTEPVNLSVYKPQNEVVMPLSLKVVPSDQESTSLPSAEPVPLLATTRVSEPATLNDSRPAPPQHPDLAAYKVTDKSLSAAPGIQSIQSEESLLSLTPSRSSSVQSLSTDVIDLTLLTPANKPNEAAVSVIDRSERNTVSSFTALRESSSTSSGHFSSTSLNLDSEEKRHLKRPCQSEIEGVDVPTKSTRCDSAQSSDNDLLEPQYQSAVLVKSMQRRVDLVAIDNEYQKSKMALLHLETLLKEKERERDLVYKKKQDMEEKVKSLENFRKKAYSRHARHLVENSANLSTTNTMTNNQSKVVIPGNSFQSHHGVQESSSRALSHQGPSSFVASGAKMMTRTSPPSSSSIAQARSSSSITTPPPLIKGKLNPTTNSYLPSRHENSAPSYYQQQHQGDNISPSVSITSNLHSPTRHLQMRQNLNSAARNSPQQTPNPPPAHRNHNLNIHRELLNENNNRSSHQTKPSTVWDRPVHDFPPPENAGSVQKNPPPAHSSQPRRFYQVNNTSTSNTSSKEPHASSTPNKLNYMGNAQTVKSPIANTHILTSHSEKTRTAHNSVHMSSTPRSDSQQQISRSFPPPQQTMAIHHVSQASQQAQINPPPAYHVAMGSYTGKSPASASAAHLSQQNQATYPISPANTHATTQSTRSNLSSLQMQSAARFPVSHSVVPSHIMAQSKQSVSGSAFSSSPRMLSGFEETQKRAMAIRQANPSNMMAAAAYHSHVSMQPHNVDTLHQEKQPSQVRIENKMISVPEMSRLHLQQQQQSFQQHLSKDQYGNIVLNQHSVPASSASSEQFIDLTCEESQRGQIQMLTDADRTFPSRVTEMRKSVNPEECENIIQEQLQFALAHRQKTFSVAEKPQRILPHKPEVYKERPGSQQGVFLQMPSNAVAQANISQQRNMNAATRAYTQQITPSAGFSSYPMAAQEAQQQALQRNASFHATFGDNRHQMQQASEKAPAHIDSYVNSNHGNTSVVSQQHRSEPQSVALHHRRLSEAAQAQSEMAHFQQHYQQAPTYTAPMSRQPHPIQPKPIQPNPVQQNIHPAATQLSGFQPNSKQAYMQAHSAQQVSIHCPQPIQSVHQRMPPPSGQVMHHVQEHLMQSQTAQMMSTMRHVVPRQPVHPQNPAMLAMMPQTEPARTQQEAPPTVVDLSDLGALGKECNVCNHPASFLCSKCKKAWYCSPQCQIKAWDAHSKECL